MRDLLERIVPAFDGLVDEIWCPEDVYPVYGQIIGARTQRHYRTIPQLAWSGLAEASARSVMLCPIPLAPLGRFPTVDEVAVLAAWLARSADRYLLVDGVYTYDFQTLTRILAPLLATGRVLTLFSCTKSWLMPDAFGLAAMSSDLHGRLGSGPPSAPSDQSRVAGWLSARPDLPHVQEQAFAREWRRLAPRIQAAAPTWLPPATGYFSVVNVPFEALLERHDMLAVPASVFGSRDRGCSVLACLHDLMAHERGDS